MNSLDLDITILNKHLQVLKNLPSQMDIDLIRSDGYDIPDSLSTVIFSTVNDGVAYQFEIKGEDFEKTIIYDNTEIYIKTLSQNKLPTKEHEAFLDIIQYYKSTFDIHKSYAYFFGEYRKKIAR